VKHVKLLTTFLWNPLLYTLIPCFRTQPVVTFSDPALRAVLIKDGNTFLVEIKVPSTYWGRSLCFSTEVDGYVL